jgi:hypothetical protein
MEEHQREGVFFGRRGVPSPSLNAGCHTLLTVYFSNHEPDAIGSLLMGLLAKCNMLVA